MVVFFLVMLAISGVSAAYCALFGMYDKATYLMVVAVLTRIDLLYFQLRRNR